jgi:hypothetical protein
MPIHDWKRVDAGLFHAFHQRWISALSDSLNTRVLPGDYFALAEQVIGGPIPDVLTLQLSSESDKPDHPAGPQMGLAVAPPRARYVRRNENEMDAYARKADRIVVRHRHGHVVSVVEIVSPGNKSSRSRMRAFVEKTTEMIRQGIHVLAIDLFPPGKRDPQGIHKAIWDEFEEEDFPLDREKPLIVATYDAGPPCTGQHVLAPLEATYSTAWQMFPNPLKPLLDPAGP